MRTPGVAKRASSLATARSQAATSWQPAAVAMPCTWAITGWGRRWIAIISSLQVSNSSRALASEQSLISERSCPAQNPGPSPRTITASHRSVGGRRHRKGGDEVAQERQGERVAALGPVEHERADAGGVLDEERGGGGSCHAPRIPLQMGMGSKR